MHIRLMVGLLIIGAVAVSTRAPAAGVQSQPVARLVNRQSLFDAYCATCHGRDGRGDGPTAQALKSRPADLTLIARRNGGTFPQDRIARFIANGDSSTPAHGSKEMPVWGPNFVALAPLSDKLVNPRIEDVVRYLKSIQAK